MNVEQMKQRVRKTVTSPKTSMDYSIRKLSHMDYMRSRGSAILDVVEKRKGSTADEDGTAKGIAESVLVNAKVMEHALVNGVVTPKVFFGNEAETPDGSIHELWLGEDANWLAMQVLEFTGVVEAQKEVEEYVKNDKGSEKSTPSPELTESFPVKS